MARRKSLKTKGKSQSGKFVITIPMLLAGLGMAGKAIAAGALTGAAGAGVKAVIDAAKHRPSPPPIHAGVD